MYRCLECKKPYRKTKCHFDYYRDVQRDGKELLPLCDNRCQQIWYERNGKPQVTAIRVGTDEPSESSSSRSTKH